MYADRYVGRRGFSPVGLGASLIVNAAVLTAFIYIAPKVITIKDKPTIVDLIPIEPPPPPIPEPRPHPSHAHLAPAPQPDTPKPPIALPNPGPILDFHPLPPVDPGPIGNLPADPGPAATPMPPLVGASVDPRYADDFQPTYPPAERRAEHEGRVVVRVLIGVDGRVKQIERVSAASDAFFAATERQARARWRFKPATRGDVPVEQWKTMSVSFVLKDE